MNRHFKQNILGFLLLITIALSSGCAPVTPVIPATFTPEPTQTPTQTPSPTPTNTPEPIYPVGTIFYSDSDQLYSVDLKSQKTKVIVQGDITYLITNKFIYTASSVKDIEPQIFKVNLNGSDREQLTTDDVIQIYNIDPNERYITYNKQGSLMLLDLSNKTSRIIAEPDKSYDGIEYIFAKSWSPDGKKFLYTRVHEPESYWDFGKIYVFDIDENTSLQLLTREVGGAEWSPDGSRIAVLSGGVYVLDIEGSVEKQIQITDKTEYSSFSGLAWSPDGEDLLIGIGERVYYHHGKNDTLELISKYSDMTQHFISSPDHSMVLYEQSNRTKETGLYLFDMLKKTTVKIYSHPPILERGKTLDKVDWSYSPVWSPDGKYLVFFTTPEPENYSGKRPIFLNVYSTETGGSISFEVPTTSGYKVFGTHWIYPQQ